MGKENKQNVSPNKPEHNDAKIQIQIQQGTSSKGNQSNDQKMTTGCKHRHHHLHHHQSGYQKGTSQFDEDDSEEREIIPSDMGLDDKHGNQDTVTLCVRGPSGKLVYFKMWKSSRLQKVIHPLAEQLGMSSDSIALSYRGRWLRLDKTPEQLCLTSSDTLDSSAQKFGKDTWKVKHFVCRHTSKKLSSDPFTVGGCKWRLVIYPHGKVADSLSVYLEVADVYVLPDWNRCVRFTLSVINQLDPKKTVKRDSWRTFMDGANVRWGWAEFMDLEELYDPNAGFVVHGSAVFETKLQVLTVNPRAPCADCLCSIEQQTHINPNNPCKTYLCTRHYEVVKNSLLEYLDECREKLANYTIGEKEALQSGWGSASVELRRLHLPEPGTTTKMIEDRFRDNYLTLATIYIACQERCCECACAECVMMREQTNLFGGEYHGDIHKLSRKDTQKSQKSQQKKKTSESESTKQDENEDENNSKQNKNSQHYHQHNRFHVNPLISSPITCLLEFELETGELFVTQPHNFSECQAVAERIILGDDYDELLASDVDTQLPSVIMEETDKGEFIRFSFYFILFYFRYFIQSQQ
eukprot:c20154_g1_i2.p1 GENE.c20154_g1_i2~~c20154_g1_i2.p1  ORF type:complete len:579 (-),score=176.18 c20154_g1_i2:52-1788(-)